jgi:hypothetical protein
LVEYALERVVGGDDDLWDVERLARATLNTYDRSPWPAQDSSALSVVRRPRSRPAYGCGRISIVNFRRSDRRTGPT